MLGFGTARELTNEGVLGVVRVLILIHQHVPETAPVQGRNLRKAAEHPHRLANQVIKIERLIALQFPLIAAINFENERIARVAAVDAARKTVRVNQLILKP